VADQEIRGERLRSRDGADLKAFERVVKDEDKETELCFSYKYLSGKVFI
jgi:hypothetical protein